MVKGVLIEPEEIDTEDLETDESYQLELGDIAIFELNSGSIAPHLYCASSSGDYNFASILNGKYVGLINDDEWPRRPTIQHIRESRAINADIVGVIPRDERETYFLKEMD